MKMATTFLAFAVLAWHGMSQGELLMTIVSPRHNEALESSTIGQGLGLEVSIAVEEDEFARRYAHTRLCACINGSAVVCGGSSDAPVIPSGELKPGRSWVHVELRDGDQIAAASRPIAVNVDTPPSVAVLTAVLTVTLDDAHRAMMLLATAQCTLESSSLTVIAVVPDAEIFAFQAAWKNVILVPESTLIGFPRGRPGYAVQMALKLLAATLVATDFYVTLDADVIATRPLCEDAAKLLLVEGKGVYTREPKSVHPHWWAGSANLLGLEPDDFRDAAFGVTPAVLSTAGALVTLDCIRRALDVREHQHWTDAWLSKWTPDAFWSEYTIYRLSLDHRRLFDALHVEPANPYLCQAVWFDSQLPWQPALAFDDKECVFSLVQSTAGVPPSDVARQLYSTPSYASSSRI